MNVTVTDDESYDMFRRARSQCADSTVDCKMSATLVGHRIVCAAGHCEYQKLLNLIYEPPTGHPKLLMEVLKHHGDLDE